MLLAFGQRSKPWDLSCHEARVLLACPCSLVAKYHRWIRKVTTPCDDETLTAWLPGMDTDVHGKKN